MSANPAFGLCRQYAGSPPAGVVQSLPRTSTPHTPGCQFPPHSPYRNAHCCSDCTSGTSPPSMQHGATAWPRSSRYQRHIRIHRMSGTRTDSPARTRLRHPIGARQTITRPDAPEAARRIDAREKDARKKRCAEKRCAEKQKGGTLNVPPYLCPRRGSNPGHAD